MKSKRFGLVGLGLGFGGLLAMLIIGAFLWLVFAEVRDSWRNHG